MTTFERLAANEIAAIRERLAKITDGVWEADDSWTASPYGINLEHEAGIAPEIDLLTLSDDGSWAGFTRYEDADFVVNTSADIQCLLDALGDAYAEIDHRHVTFAVAASEADE